jgi:hypothetical protein
VYKFIYPPKEEHIYKLIHTARAYVLGQHTYVIGVMHVLLSARGLKFETAWGIMYAPTPIRSFRRVVLNIREDRTGVYTRGNDSNIAWNGSRGVFQPPPCSIPTTQLLNKTVVTLM